jgi:hypothetical protein
MTTASAHAPPPVTTRKNQSSASKQKKIWSSLTSPVFQAGGCEKLPKGNEEKKIVPKATAAPAHIFSEIIICFQFIEKLIFKLCGWSN